MEAEMNNYELISYETNYYINLIRIKKHQKETNPELEFQLKTQRIKLHNLGVNTDDFEYE